MGAADFVCYGVSSLLAKAKRQRSGGWLHLTRSPHPALWLITWDPSQPVATRPLAIQKNGTWYTYGLDLTKNVCEGFCSSDYIGTAYTYSPFDEITVSWLIFVFAIDDALLIEGV